MATTDNKIMTYESLKEEEQLVVDTVAQLRLNGDLDGDDPYTEQAEAVLDQLGEGVYSYDAVRQKLSDYNGIIERRIQMEANSREEHEGEVTVERGQGKYRGPADGINLAESDAGGEGQTTDQPSTDEERDVDELWEKLGLAAERLEEPLDSDDAETVAESAGLDRNYILRVWEELEYELDVNPSTRLHFDDLDDYQQEILKYFYWHRDALQDRSNRSITAVRIADIVDCAEGTVRTTYRRHGWMVWPELAPEEVADAGRKYRHFEDGEDGEDETEDGSTAQQTSESGDVQQVIEALGEADVEYSVSIEAEGGFETVQALIEAGYSEVARMMYEQGDEGEVVISESDAR